MNGGWGLGDLLLFLGAAIGAVFLRWGDPDRPNDWRAMLGEAVLSGAYMVVVWNVAVQVAVARGLPTWVVPLALKNPIITFSLGIAGGPVAVILYRIAAIRLIAWFRRRFGWPTLLPPHPRRRRGDRAVP